MTKMKLSKATNDQLLAALKEEREKYTRSDKERMQYLCDQLVVREVYPAESKIGKSPLAMVESWGVDWHEYKGTLNCPHCNADLCDREQGPPFKLEIGVVDRDLDCRVYDSCPKCKGRFNENDTYKRHEQEQQIFGKFLNKNLSVAELEELKTTVAKHLDIFIWGTYGPKGNKPMEYKPLSHLETEHLENIILTQNLSLIYQTAVLTILKDRYWNSAEAFYNIDKG